MAAADDDLNLLSFGGIDDDLLSSPAAAAPLLTPAPQQQQQQTPHQQKLRAAAAGGGGVLVMEPLPLPAGAAGAAGAAGRQPLPPLAGGGQPPHPAQHPAQQPPQPPPVGRDYYAAVGGLETAKLALEALRTLVADAVFLDEGAFANAGTLQLYQQRLQRQQRRVLQLEQEHEALREEARQQQELLARQKAQTRAAQDRCRELQAELDSNAAVFELHYQELLLKSGEIERLKAVVEGLSSA